jgi:hypothetical protein
LFIEGKVVVGQGVFKVYFVPQVDFARLGDAWVGLHGRYVIHMELSLVIGKLEEHLEVPSAAALDLENCFIDGRAFQELYGSDHDASLQLHFWHYHHFLSLPPILVGKVLTDLLSLVMIVQVL